MAVGLLRLREPKVRIEGDALPAVKKLQRLSIEHFNELRRNDPEVQAYYDNVVVQPSNDPLNPSPPPRTTCPFNPQTNFFTLKLKLT